MELSTGKKKEGWDKTKYIIDKDEQSLL